MELFGAENGEFEYKGTQYEIPYLEFKHDVGLRDMNWASQIMKGCSHLGMSQHTEEKMVNVLKGVLIEWLVVFILNGFFRISFLSSE